MPTLADLPQEILLQIAKEMSYDSLVSFSKSTPSASQAIRSSPSLVANALLWLNYHSIVETIDSILCRRRHPTSPSTKEFEGDIIACLLKPNTAAPSDLQILFLKSILQNQAPALQALFDTNQIKLSNERVLQTAISSNNVDIISILIKMGFKTTSNIIFQSLHSPQILTLLIDLNVPAKDAIISHKGTTKSALCQACEKGQVEAVAILIAAGSDMHFNHGKPLRNAIMGNHNKVVKRLIDKGVNVHLEHDGEIPLMTCCRAKNSEAFFLLIKSGAKHTERAQAILEQAASSRMLDVIEWMLDNTAIVLGESVLEAAVLERDIVRFRRFYDAGARFTTEGLLEGMMEDLLLEGALQEWKDVMC
ncbi:hypothetical protein HDU97_005237 [Phlyctochytrium planicorne]|nr:hypothetical protein HDU97_005237 [Phlyctochytrium planicorne]